MTVFKSFTLAFFTTLAAVPADAESNSIMIATGGVSGVYYPTGLAICNVLSNSVVMGSSSCAVLSTGGSIDNLNALSEQLADIAVIQSDVHQFNYNDYASADQIQSLFSVHSEPVHVLVRTDAEIKNVSDLRGKRVNVGNAGSGTRVVADILLEMAGLEVSDLGAAFELTSSQQGEALCSGELQVAVWVSGLPNASSMEATSTCPLELLALDFENTPDAVRSNPAYATAIIPAGTYPGIDYDVPTWGPVATVVTSEALSEVAAYNLVSSVFENLDAFRQFHPAFSDLRASNMTARGLVAPIHEGALRYFEEQGLK